MITITLKQAKGACREALEAVARSLGSRARTETGVLRYLRRKHAGRALPVTDLLALPDGLEWALWALDTLGRVQILRRFACHCAERALVREAEAGRAVDHRSWAAVNVTRAHALGMATDEDLAAARAAAWDAGRFVAEGAARAAARAAAWAAGRSAWDAGRSSGRSAAWAAGRSAWDAGRDAGRDAAWDAERERQSQHLAAMCEESP